MKKATGWRKVVRRFFWGGMICLAAVSAVVGICNAIVKHSAKGHLYSNVQEIPYRHVGLLLGTSPTMANGNPNRYYHHRISAAASLYFANKISYILISGDNLRWAFPTRSSPSTTRASAPTTPWFGRARCSDSVRSPSSPNTGTTKGRYISHGRRG